MHKLFFLAAIVCLSLTSFSQNVAINNTAAAADNSAMLDVSSNSKGILIPRLSTLQRTGIASPANGLLVFDNNTNSFWFFSGTWKELAGGGSKDSLFLPYDAAYSDPGKLFAVTNTSPAVGGTAINGKRTVAGSGVNPAFSMGVWGDNSDGAGLVGTSNTGIGTYGFSFNNYGIYGYSTAPGKSAVYGTHANPNGIGLMGEIQNSGIAVYGLATGALGKAAVFENTNASNTDPLMTLLQAGTGPGVTFNIPNPVNNKTGISVITAGYGTGIYVESVGGSAAHFVRKESSIDSQTLLIQNEASNGAGIRVTQINVDNTKTCFNLGHLGKGVGIDVALSNTSNTSNIMEAYNFGTGGGINMMISNVASTGIGMNIMHQGTGSAMVIQANKGKAAVFSNADVTNNLPVVDVTNNGTNSAAVFLTSSNVNNLPAVSITNDGTGTSLLIQNNNGAAVGSLSTFKKNGVNVARIDGTGKGYFNGGTQASGADMAEAFDVTGNRNEYEPGDVLVIATDKDRTVERSSTAYSTLVAGVYATKPGMLMTEESIDTDISDKVPMGVIGVIPTKVCLENGEIKRGDLIVTSSITGVAMKADPGKVKPGQIIGRALENYSSTGIGKIRVLVNVK